MANERQVSGERVVEAPPEEVFEVLADPGQHAAIDGSGTVKGSRSDGSQRLALGSRFGMSMRIGLPYAITNEVVEFEEGRRITWRHFAGHRWRWELEPAGPQGTKVRETYDWSTARFPRAQELAGFPARNKRGIDATLDRLADYVGGG